MNLGLLLGGVLVFLAAKHQAVDTRSVIDAALAAALGGLLLARVGYVGTHWTYYADHLQRAVQPRDGGLLWQGALIGAVTGAAAMAAMRGMSLTRLLDILTPGAASLAVFGWLACLMVGCAWGIETYPGQGLLWKLSLDLPDLYGIRQPRIAVQLLGAVWSVILLIITLILQRRPQRRGTVFKLWVTLHSLGSLSLGFLRGDEMVSVVGWRVDQLANMVLSVVGITLLGAQAIGRCRETAS